MRLTPRKKQTGLSLVELMIAMVIGFIIVGGALYLGTRSMQASRDNIRMSFLNQELRDALYRVTTDLKRASYWGANFELLRVNSVATLSFSGVTAGDSVSIAVSFEEGDVTDAIVDKLGAQSTGTTLVYLFDGNRYRATVTAYNSGTNTFTATLVDTFPNKVLAANGGAGPNSWTIIGPSPGITQSGNCITFNYDQNGDGLVTTSNPDERIGYRFDTVEGAIESRSGGAACADGGWVNITDEDTVEVTAFTITDNCASGCSTTGSALTASVREYTILIRGRLRSENTITREVRETVRVRNNQIS